MKLTLTPQLLELRNSFNHLEDSSRKEKLLPAKQIGYFRNEDGGVPSGGSSTIDHKNLATTINILFSDRSFSAPYEVGRAMRLNPTTTILNLIKAASKLNMVGDIDRLNKITIALLGTLEKERLQQVLLDILVLEEDLVERPRMASSGEDLTNNRITSFDNTIIRVALKQLGEKIVPDLVKLLTNKAKFIRGRAILALGSLGKDASESIQELTNIAKNDKKNDDKVSALNRGRALDAIKKILDDLTKKTEAAF